MRRGQVAIEFLTTYGWALMLVLVVLGALAYFGTFNPTRYVPDRCEVQAEFTCEDYLLTKDEGLGRPEVAFVMVNSLGKKVTVEKAYITYESETGDDNCGLWQDIGGGNLAQTRIMAPGDKVEMVCNRGSSASIHFPAVGEKARVKFFFNYTLDGGSIPHPVEGEIVAAVQSQS